MPPVSRPTILTSSAPGYRGTGLSQVAQQPVRLAWLDDNDPAVFQLYRKGELSSEQAAALHRLPGRDENRRLVMQEDVSAEESPGSLTQRFAYASPRLAQHRVDSPSSAAQQAERLLAPKAIYGLRAGAKHRWRQVLKKASTTHAWHKALEGMA